MTRVSIFTLALWAAVFSGVAQDASADCGCASTACADDCCDIGQSCCCCQGSTTYVAFEAMFLDLDLPRNQPLVLNTISSATLLDLDALDYTFEFVPRVTIGKKTSCGNGVELSYFGSDLWRESETVLGNNDLQIPGALALATLDFFDADRITVSQSADLNSVEANYFHSIAPQWDALVGFRFLKFDEDININSMDLDSGTSDYNVSTRNELYGAQIGIRGTAHYCSGLQLSGVAKAGIYGNSSSQSQFVGDFNNTSILRDTQTEHGTISSISEVGIQAAYQINQDLRLTGGYNLLWLINVGRAGDQLDFTDMAGSGTTLRDEGSAFLHGATLGMIYEY